MRIPAPTPTRQPAGTTPTKDPTVLTAAIAAGKRPAPFRTRKLSLPAPMVLHSTGCGRVGHRRHQTTTGGLPNKRPPVFYAITKTRSPSPFLALKPYPFATSFGTHGHPRNARNAKTNRRSLASTHPEVSALSLLQSVRSKRLRFQGNLEVGGRKASQRAHLS